MYLLNFLWKFIQYFCMLEQGGEERVSPTNLVCILTGSSGDKGPWDTWAGQSSPVEA